MVAVLLPKPPSMLPLEFLNTLVLGDLKLGRLNILKISARNCTAVLSVNPNGISLISERSVTNRPGPSSPPRPTVPRKPAGCTA